jgi:hypothetical protein
LRAAAAGALLQLTREVYLFDPWVSFGVFANKLLLGDDGGRVSGLEFSRACQPSKMFSLSAHMTISRASSFHSIKKPRKSQQTTPHTFINLFRLSPERAKYLND